MGQLQGMESKIPRCKGSGGFASRLKLRLALIAVLRWSTEMPYLPVSIAIRELSFSRNKGSHMLFILLTAFLIILTNWRAQTVGDTFIRSLDTRSNK